MQTFFLNLALFLVGAGAFIWAYLAFSPMTRDLVVFLSRDQQITIFRFRRFYWACAPSPWAGCSCAAFSTSPIPKWVPTPYSSKGAKSSEPPESVG